MRRASLVRWQSRRWPGWRGDWSYPQLQNLTWRRKESTFLEHLLCATHQVTPPFTPVFMSSSPPGGLIHAPCEQEQAEDRLEFTKTLSQ